MKLLLAALMLVLAVGAAPTRPRPPIWQRFVPVRLFTPQPTLTVRAGPNFGPGHRPGDHLRWIIELQNQSDSLVDYTLVIQSPTNLALAAPQVACPRCLFMSQSGADQRTVFLRTPSGMRAVIVEDATIVGEGDFSVAVKTVRNTDQLANPTLAATLSNQTAPVAPPPLTNEASPAPSPGPATNAPDTNPTVANAPATNPTNAPAANPPVLNAAPANPASPNGAPIGPVPPINADPAWTPPPPPLPIWPLIAVAVLGAAAATAAGVNHLRRRWWADRITVVANANAGAAAARPGEIAEHVAVRVEWGAAGPRASIPVTRTDRNG